MKRTVKFGLLMAVLGYFQAGAQPGAEDYARALSIKNKFSNKVTHQLTKGKWIEQSDTFFYKAWTGSGEKNYLVTAGKFRKTELKDSFLIQKFDERLFPKPTSTERYWAEEDNEWSGQAVLSPDKKQEAFIREYNVWVRSTTTGKLKQLTFDGSIGEYYSCHLIWSPDSKNLATCKIRPAEKQYFYMIESSPDDQIQPRLHKREYRKPGSALPFHHPHIIQTGTGRIIKPETTLFSNPFAIERLQWNANGTCVTFEYNQRGHQVYRLLEMDASNGAVRTLAEESFPTFVIYGRIFRQEIEQGKRFIWSSERDNYHHLYMYNTQSGKPEYQITKGEWYVRSVVSVDEKARTILFAASGIEKDMDPYYVKYYRINFDGSNLVCLTPEKGMHQAEFSSNHEWMVDTWSEVNVPPVTVLRRVADGKVISVLEKADDSELRKNGWQEPEPFVAKGRDGVTDIWGIIVRPTHFTPEKTYPVLEYIYAGPGGQHVPKTFMAYNKFLTPMAELGFIVVMIDGMGTSYRSKAFEDISSKNLYDAGLPDRIKWIEAASIRYPYMDKEQVGVYGGSAGGQNAMCATLQFPDFYKAAYAGCGCHDNRMDKIWWNEQWLGYPIGEQYEANSNVVNAHKLRTPLMLMVGELDDNVDPASTLQVVNALIKANKDFELLYVPGAGHQLGDGWAERKRMDFFVKHLYKVNPPAWNE